MATGNIIVVEPTDDYKRIHKSIIRNKNIDCLTLGIYTKITVLGAEWQLNIKGLSSALNLSDAKIRKSIGILEKEGYIVREPIRGEKGQMQGWNYFVYPIPIDEHDRSKAGYPKIQFDEHAQVAAEKETDIDRLTQKPTTRLTDNTESGEDNNNRLNITIDLNNNKTNKDKKENIIKEKRFKKPTVEEVQSYIDEKQYHFDAESFIAYYESNGWKVGKSSMKNWKMACVTWEHTYLQRHPNASQFKQTNQCQKDDSVTIGGQTYK